jgi:hypothetical protein
LDRGPEKAGVGGSIPSLATTLLESLIFESRARVFARRAMVWTAALRKAGVGGSIPSLATTFLKKWMLHF